MKTLLFLCLIASMVQTTTPSSSLKEMKVIVVDSASGTGALKVDRASIPPSREGELLVRVHAAGVNPVDWKMARSGRRRGVVDANAAFVPGFDVSGVVESVGPGVTKFKPGDAVFAMLDLRRGGGYAQFAIVNESEAAMKPLKASHTEAAGVPLAALTAWQAIFDTAKLEKGQTVLIHAGAGGVGSFAVQLAKWKGAKVIATASSPENLQLLRDLGVDQVINYKEQKFDDIAKDVDVVLDPIGGDTQARSFNVLKKGGILISIVGQPSQQKAQDAGVRAAWILVKPSAEELGQIAKLIDDGALKPIVGKTFLLEEAAKAHELSASGRARGKIVLVVRE